MKVAVLHAPSRPPAELRVGAPRARAARSPRSRRVRPREGGASAASARSSPPSPGPRRAHVRPGSVRRRRGVDARRLAAARDARLPALPGAAARPRGAAPSKGRARRSRGRSFRRSTRSAAPVTASRPLSGALERAVPPRRSTLRFIAEHEPDLVLVTPLLDFGSPQLDYLRAAKLARNPHLLLRGELGQPDEQGAPARASHAS